MLGNIGYIFFSVVVSCICFSLAQQSMKDQLEEMLKESVLTKKEVRAKYREHTRNIRLLWIIGIVWLASIVLALSGSDSTIAFLFTVAAVAGLGYLLIKKANGKQVIAIRFLAVALGLGFGLVLGNAIHAGTVTYFLGIACAVAFAVLAYFVGKGYTDDLEDEEDDDEPAPVERREPTTPPTTSTRNEKPTPTPKTARPTTGYRPAKATKENVNNPPRRRRSEPNARSDDGGDRNFDTYIIEQLSKTEEGRQQLLQLLKAQR